MDSAPERRGPGRPPRGEPFEKVTVRIPATLRARVWALARAQKRTVTDVFITALTEYLLRAGSGEGS